MRESLNLATAGVTRIKKRAIIPVEDLAGYCDDLLTSRSAWPTPILTLHATASEFIERFGGARFANDTQHPSL